MTIEFRKKIKHGKKVCTIHTEKVEEVEYPLWLTKENFETIKKLMKW